MYGTLMKSAIVYRIFKRRWACPTEKTRNGTCYFSDRKLEAPLPLQLPVRNGTCYFSDRKLEGQGSLNRVRRNHLWGPCE